ncbi:MAG: class I SAM-dependent RNA methyltransferase [Thermodesulfobacteria bacterium]|nr:class I SAM-dependent RNA methyltransferase [Thermodesulfobacteriota bacterium]
MERIFPGAQDRFHGIIPSPSPFGYRARARLFPQRDNGGKGLGFFRQGSKKVQPIDRCLVIDQVLDRLLGRLNNWMKDRGNHLPGLTRYVLLEKDILDEWALSIFFKRRPKGAQLEELESLAEFFSASAKISSKSALLTSAPDGLCFYQDEKLAPAGLMCASGGFFQANLEQNRNLVRGVVELAKETGASSVTELFCGAGNFSIPLARAGMKVAGFELDEKALEFARKNAQLNECAQMADFGQMDLFSPRIDLLTQLRSDCLILDPPRVGAKELCKQMGSLNPRFIIYVSCDPMTLARDLDAMRQWGYGLEKVLALDLFPQTYHIESVVLLEKKG